MHSILIFLIIAIIVALQIKIARNAIARIDFLKQIIPGDENFEAVTVYIRESQIKTISTTYILENLGKFGPVEIIPDTVKVNADAILPLVTTETLKVDDTITYDTMIWVMKEDDKKEIPYKLLRRYEQLGWEQIN